MPEPTPIPTTIAIEPVKVVAAVIKSELALAEGQIMLAYQPYVIPENKGLFVAIREIGSKVIANNNYANGEGEGVTEIQEATVKHLIQIDMMSFNAEARIRKEEVVMALRSVAAQQAQEVNLMQFGRMPGDLVDASSLEETKYLNRFTMTLAVTALHRKTKAVDYFETFNGEFQENDAEEATPFTPANPTEV
jgi:hypothetical protein